MTRKHFAIHIGALALVVHLSQAELAWQTKEVHLDASPLEQMVEARYPFRNTGTEIVRFKSFKSACGCLEVTASTMTVPPGATGEVKVVFTPEFRIGSQKRPIAVQFDDAKQSRIALYLTVDIPEIVRPEPKFLRWGEGETMAAKAVTIVTDAQYPVESMRVRTANPHWVTRIEPVTNTSNYRLEVLPTRGATPRGEYVELEARLKNGQIKRTNLYVVVR